MQHPFYGLWQSPRAAMSRRPFPALLAGALCASCVAVAAVVSMQPPSGGGELRIPVVLYGEQEEELSSVQFDLAYDPAQFELVAITAGDAATGAGKEVIVSETAPGHGRVLITGFNDHAMADGQVATVVLRPLNVHAPQHGLLLGEVLASDPDGNAVSIDYADLFQYPPAPPAENLDAVAESQTETEEAPDQAGPEKDGTETPSIVPPTEEALSESSAAATEVSPSSAASGAAPAGGSARTAPRNRDENTPKSSTDHHLAISGSERATIQSGSPARNRSNGTPAADDVQSYRLPARGTSETSDKTRGIRPSAPNEPEIRRSAVGESAKLALARPTSALAAPPEAGTTAYLLALEDAGVEAGGPSPRVIAFSLALAVTTLALVCLVLTDPRTRRPRRHSR